MKEDAQIWPIEERNSFLAIYKNGVAIYKAKGGELEKVDIHHLDEETAAAVTFDRGNKVLVIPEKRPNTILVLKINTTTLKMDTAKPILPITLNKVPDSVDFS